MNNQAVCLRVLKKSSLLLFASTFFFGCSHSFNKIKITSTGKVITQILKLKITHPEGKEKLEVYCQINRKKEEANLEGLGRFNKHVFTLNIIGNKYSFKDHVNNKKNTGLLEDFSLFPISKKFIFSKLDIKNAQPIIITNSKKKLHVSITVIKQDEVFIK